MTEDDPGMQALRAAARLELGRVYGKTSPEYRRRDNSQDIQRQLDMAREQDLARQEVAHFINFGWSDAEIAVRLGYLGIRKHHVAAIRGAA